MQKSDRLLFSKAMRREMGVVAQVIRTTANWYASFSSEDDMDQHFVDEAWEEENYNKRDFYIGYGKQEQDAIGILSLQAPSADDIYIGYLYIQSHHVGKRYGKEFLDFAKNHALKQNKKSLILLCHPEAKWALKAYRKYGFDTFLPQKKDILCWNQGWLKGYYEEGMELMKYTIN